MLFFPKLHPLPEISLGSRIHKSLYLSPARRVLDMAGRSFEPGANQEEINHRRSRLKIRRAPSSALPASLSSSFHGSCSKMMIREGCTTTTKPSQPLIFHTFEPETILTEPAEFMSVVQRLTGSPATRKLQRVSMRELKKIESSERQVRSIPERKLSVQQDPLKEGRTIILAPAAGKSCSPCTEPAFTNDFPAAASPTCPNYSGSRKSISQTPQLPYAINQDNYGANSLAAPSSLYTKQLNLYTNHLANHPPSSSISANSATYEENYSAYTSPMSSNSPLSPNSSLTYTSNSEGCFSMEEGGASSSCRELLYFPEEKGSTLSIEEDGSINFFDFSSDSYYGNHNYTVAEDELDQSPNFSNAWNPYLSA